MTLEICGLRALRTDVRGQTTDIHAATLLHTFATHLSKASIPLRTAQAAIQHSGPSVTASVHTVPQLINAAGAVASPPYPPLDGVKEPAAAATLVQSHPSSHSALASGQPS